MSLMPHGEGPLIAIIVIALGGLIVGLVCAARKPPTHRAKGRHWE